MLAAGSDASRAIELSTQQAAVQARIDGMYGEWEELEELLEAARVFVICVAGHAAMFSLLHASMLHASPAEPGLRPARPHGKQVATTHKRGEHLQAGRSTFRRSAPTAVERGAVRGMHRPTPVGRFSWDALNVTNATQCAGKKCYFPSQREGEGWLVGRPSCLRPQCRDATGRLGRNQIPEMAPPTRWFPPYTRAWALAEELRVGFGMDHLMREPPLLATLPEAHERQVKGSRSEEAPPLAPLEDCQRYAILRRGAASGAGSPLVFISRVHVAEMRVPHGSSHRRLRRKRTK
eukprot:scaffold76021_cov62-Phaeocystis_antarctica.AAC.4